MLWFGWEGPLNPFSAIPSQLFPAPFPWPHLDPRGKKGFLPFAGARGSSGAVPSRLPLGLSTPGQSKLSTREQLNHGITLVWGGTLKIKVSSPQSHPAPPASHSQGHPALAPERSSKQTTGHKRDIATPWSFWVIPPVDGSPWLCLHPRVPKGTPGSSWSEVMEEQELGRTELSSS